MKSLLLIISLFMVLNSTLAQEANKKLRVACIGNSVTYGAKITNRPDNCYPAQLQKMLSDNYEVQNFGFSGATLLKNGHKPYWEKEVFEQSKAFKPDIVIIHLGLNDTDPRNWPNYKDDFRKDYYELIDTYRELNKDAKVWICRLTPIFNQHPRFKSGTRDWFWQIQKQIEQIAAVKNTGLIDLHSPLYSRPDLFPDALHPNAEGAGILASKVYSEVSGDYGGITLPDVFSDNMVLQRNENIPVYGTANAGDQVNVCIANHEAETITDEHGKWSIELPSIPAGGPYELKIQTNDTTITLKNILIGEVWLCSGQSNMAFTLKQCSTGKEDIPIANHPNLRFYNMKATVWPKAKAWDKTALNELNKLNYFNASWKECTPESAAEFSAIAYYYGEELQKALNVPVGIIMNAVGGSTTEAWIDRKSLEHHPVLVDVMDDWLTNDFVQPWCRERAKLNLKNTDNTLQGHPFQAAYLYETGIAPLAHFPIKGVCWYQGESNAHNVEFHEILFPQLVKSWRKVWGDNFPFYYVQLSSLNRPTWGHFRDSQRRLQAIIPNSGMVVSSDCGHPTDVHPKQKKPIGVRLANLSLANTYGIDIEYSGPIINNVILQGKKALLNYINADGLQAADGKDIKGFEVTGEDGVFYSAEAHVINETIELKSKKVDGDILHVRYGWQAYSKGNLVNELGLPASTFSTEY